MKTKFFTLFLLIILVFYTNNTLANEVHDEEPSTTPVDEHTGDFIGVHEAEDQCENPTFEITIIGGENNQITFDKQKYKVPKNTCVEVIFANLATVEHDVSIDEIQNSIQKVHLHLSNNTDGNEANGVISMHMQTPNLDTEYEIYCSIAGHREAGMYATLIVGEGLSEDSLLPGFGFIMSFFAISALLIVVRKKLY